jgi:hypothetical protein
VTEIHGNAKSRGGGGPAQKDYFCLLRSGYGDNNEIRTIRFSSKIFIVGDQKTPAQPGVGLMAPRVGIVAHHQANLVLRILLGEEE